MTLAKNTGSGASTTTLLTAEDLAFMPEDGTLHDLVEGVLVDMPRPKYRHGYVAANLIALIGSYVRAQRLGQVVTESGFILARNPDTVRGPDVAFVSGGRILKPDDQDRYYEGAPDLAIEIVSPNDNAVELRELIEQYLTAGAQRVWVVYPMFRTVDVYRPDQTFAVLHAQDELDGEAVLPGFRVPVRELFE